MDVATVRTCRWLLGPLALGAGVIHLALVPTHADEWWGEGSAFAFWGVLQVGLAVLLALRPRRRWLVAAIGVSVLAVAAWAVTRTSGMPVGPHAGTVEPVDAVGVVTVGLEVLLALGAVAALAGWVPRPRRRALAVVTAALPTLAVLGLTTAVLASPEGGHEHTPDDHGHAADGHEQEHHDHESAGGHHHGTCTDPVTDDQQAAADELVAETRAGLERYEDFAAAEADGFVPITPTDVPLVHYASYQSMDDGRVLDPDAPESVMYFFPRNGADPVLVGAMYFAEPGEPGPQIGGCLTQWHVHENLCIAPGEGMVGVVDAAGRCPGGSSNDVTQEMLHVWDVDLSAGPFSELAEANRTQLAAAVIEKIAER